jgi:hypothetical protein
LPWPTLYLKSLKYRAQIWMAFGADSQFIAHQLFGKIKTVGRMQAPFLVTTLVLIAGVSRAQLTTGLAEGILQSSDGGIRAGTLIVVSGAAGFETSIRTSSAGEFALFLPYGWYRLTTGNHHNSRISGPTVFIAPLQVTRIDLLADASGGLRLPEEPQTMRVFAPWADFTRLPVYPEAFSLQGVLATLEPGTVTEPLDFTGLASNRLGVTSHDGFSWTDTQFKLAGLDATDAYQPGRPVILPNVQTLNGVALRTAFDLTASDSYGTEIGLYPRQPGISWHGTISSTNTGSSLASTNLPPIAERGIVQQADRFTWFTRDQMEAGGPLTRWADFFASGAGQWASQSGPLASPGTEQVSRIFYGDVRSRIRAGAHDQIELLYTGSRVDLSDGGVPAGMEALTGRRMSPEFNLPYGFLNEEEADSFNFAQAGWTHLFARNSEAGALQVRYGFSLAHLDAKPSSQPVPDQSRIELVGNTVTGASPIANLAVQRRHELAAAWQPRLLQMSGIRHQITAGGAWKASLPQNRFNVPSDLNLITADGVPAFVVEFNTPLQNRESVRSFSGYLADHFVIGRMMSFDVGGLLDLSRGSLPSQSSPAGAFTPSRTFAGSSDLIVWNSISPRAGFAWLVPHARGLVVRGLYARLYSPLAGRYLDFGNPNSLGGKQYQWIDHNADGWFEPDEQGTLLMRFGGPYSSISPALKRPYADEFNVGAELRITSRNSANIHLFRRDDKDRIAAIDTGLSPDAFTPVSILDPGPDGIVGTFDDQLLTVYQQHSTTLGQDRYLLTNPRGLRALNEGLVAEAQSEWRSLTFHASFAAEKAWAPTNPGNAFFENDPGVIGALCLDPNTAIHAAGRTFTDRAYVGKVQALYRLPSRWSGMELASVANYTDGLAFARQLLVAGLTQGPFLVPATVRGSPEGGNRAQYVLNWNLRVGKDFSLTRGHLITSFDILNVTNAGQKIQESDLTGTSFNLRPPVAIQPARFARIGVRYEF